MELKDAYFAILIAKNQGKFLRFTVDGQPFQFNCLPFGLSCAPWVFTKTLKPVPALLRELGARLAVYINDILFLAESREKMTSHVLSLVILLEHLGFVVNSEKSVLSTTQKIEFLGLSID